MLAGSEPASCTMGCTTLITGDTIAAAAAGRALILASMQHTMDAEGFSSLFPLSTALAPLILGLSFAATALVTSSNGKNCRRAEIFPPPGIAFGCDSVPFSGFDSDYGMEHIYFNSVPHSLRLPANAAGPCAAKAPSCGTAPVKLLPANDVGVVQRLRQQRSMEHICFSGGLHSLGLPANVAGPCAAFYICIILREATMKLLPANDVGVDPAGSVAKAQQQHAKNHSSCRIWSPGAKMPVHHFL